MRFHAFAYVYLLGLVPILLALYAYGFWRQRRTLARFVELPLVARLLPRVDRPRRWAKALCVVGAVACLVVALMQPRWGETEEEAPRRGRDLVIALDVSLSMLAEDVSPSRLERAKAIVRGLVESVRAEGGHRLALVTFAGRAALQSPLTLDYGLFLERLAEASPARIPIKGTRIGDALHQTVRTLGGLEPGYADLLLITDGDDHGSLPDEAAGWLADQGVGLYVVGVGDSRVGARIPLEDDDGRSSFLRYDGFEVSTRMRSDLLASMALQGDGVYLAASDGEDPLARLYASRIADLPRREIDAHSRPVAAERFQWFALAALILLGAEMAFRERQTVGRA
jgi:Ca-activated chloride channel homolog